MITGGNRGLGLALSDRFHGESFSRHNGHDITKDRERLARISLDYDVFINNAFDGPFHEPWADFAQVRLLHAVADLWRQHNKAGFIVNIGSVGTETMVAPDPSFETYRVSKQALKFHSHQWSQAFKKNLVRFRTTLLTLDRLDTELSRSRPNWTGNGHDLDSVCDMVQLLVNGQPNTCIQEIIAMVNFDHAAV